MKKILGLLILLIVIAPIHAITVTEGKWKIEISDVNGKSNIVFGDLVLISGNMAQFKIGDGKEYNANDAMTFNGAVVNDNYSDVFGAGKKIDLSYSLENNPLKATHTYYLYKDLSYILTDLKIENDGIIESNYMSPIQSSSTSTFLPSESGTNAMLIVPFDNDAWVKYTSNIFRNASCTSYESGCLYSTKNGQGLVLGSIEHDNWKTGIMVDVASPNIVSSIKVFGGISDNYPGAAPTTRDQLPHGKVKGNFVKSPKIMIGYFDDWRKGMETYADANALVAPKLHWKSGTPFGWNSWGNAQTNLSYVIADGVGNFFANDLAPEFTNDGVTYIGLDSYWDRITAQNRRRLINNCRNRNQKVGIYWTPFVDWSGDVNREVEGTNGKYKYGDIHLKINGKSAEFPGGGKGWAIDPTHPGARMRIDYYIDQWKETGYEFIKLDFMTHGTFEGDSWSDPNITTGIQAYNSGMKYVVDRIDGKMYINLSIAPLFPSEYAHGRRYACDTYGTMRDTQYALNALTYSWWTDRVYSYNDPDYMVFGKFTGSGAYPAERTYELHSLGENRARFTSVITSGLCLLGDDFVNCTEEARTRAKNILRKPEINKIAKIGKSFHPLKSGSWGSNQSDLFIHNVEDTLYVAAYHFTTSPTLKTLKISIDDLGLEKNKDYVIWELWTDTKTETVLGDVVNFEVPRTDARIFKIYPKKAGAVAPIKSNKAITLSPNPCHDVLELNGIQPTANMSYEIFSTSGSCVMSLSSHDSAFINVEKLSQGSYILYGKDLISGITFSDKFLKI